jgi:hypothetical protein
MPERDAPKTALSASRIKTLETCSWLYYCKYVLKIPDKSNEGAMKGSVTHAVMEVLGDRARRQGYFDRIAYTQDVDSVPSISRMISWYANKLGIGSPENLADIKNMCLAGINYDFYGDSCGQQEGHSEIEFNIVKNEGGKFYKIRGFLDKLFIYDGGRQALIRDFKTSKKVYVGEEVTNNLQHFFYSLATRHMFPNVEKSQTQFLFLRHPMNAEDSSGVINIDLNDNDIVEGFEYELTDWQILVDNFNLRDALAGIASDMPYPTDGTFGGPLACGRAKCPNTLKKDGTPMWYCPAKFPFEYYKILRRSDNAFIASCFIEDKQEMMQKYPREEYLYKWEVYSGCPTYNRANY